MNPMCFTIDLSQRRRLMNGQSITNRQSITNGRNVMNSRSMTKGNRTMKRWSRFVAGLMASVMILTLLAGCTMAIDPNFQPQASSDQIEPSAGEWQHWVLDSNDEVMPAAPPNAE